MLVRAWYEGAAWLYLLRPLSLLFEGLVAIRRRRLCATQCALPVPVVVVGNIAVGGTGKTPAVMALIEALQDAGLRPAVVSRGYGGRAPYQPYSVTDDDDPALCGDEALLIRRRGACPVVVDRQRDRAAQWLLTHTDCNVIVSDDGLQHYRLWRSFELVLIDGARGLGNGWCLPAGPLREPPQRLQQVDHVLINGDDQRAVSRLCAAGRYSQMQLLPECWINLQDGAQVAVDALPLQGRRLQAMAGIGHPQRFFGLVGSLGYDIAACHHFGDHHRYRAEDLPLDDNAVLVMTEKDAVKCAQWATAQCWYLRVRAVPAPELLQLVVSHCQTFHGAHGSVS